MTENPANPTLVGNFLPQVPAHRGNVRVVYSNSKYATVAAGLQFVGAQFDEDQNVVARRLPKYAVMDLTAMRPIGRTFEIFGRAESFRRRGTSSARCRRRGSPRLVSAGFRLRRQGG